MLKCTGLAEQVCDTMENMLESPTETVPSLPDPSAVGGLLPILGSLASTLVQLLGSLLDGGLPVDLPLGVLGSVLG